MTTRTEQSKKTVFIVYAHPSSTSFNAALLDVSKRTLAELGHDIIVSDLYAMGWNPVLGSADFKGGLKNSEEFQYSPESEAAFLEGRLSDDIMAEQSKVAGADLVIFQFPLQCMSVPAIMKGWIERVLQMGFSFEWDGEYVRGKLQDKRFILMFTCGGQEDNFTERGIAGMMEVITWHIHINFNEHGAQVLRPHITYSPGLKDLTARQKQLRDWEERLPGLFQEKPLFMFKREDFEPVDGDFTKGLVLKDDILKRTCNNTPGQTLGKPVPYFYG